MKTSAADNIFKYDGRDFNIWLKLITNVFIENDIVGFLGKNVLATEPENRELIKKNAIGTNIVLNAIDRKYYQYIANIDNPFEIIQILKALDEDNNNLRAEKWISELKR
ncbi:hypothetical protein BCR36DRAFT_374879 [Piromyces finnis]|uniref:Uncharacterized protein n=1 Tax=Piromyces finnis TaxID=1754191 RepID=A0A1Y1UWS2_9FUNG|nr:hypothetical protein BCR36DRAFT_374879 [Piromyces finnis]|eukprot:ORX41948.1 hypothetical protein BCR36DRAFT_374879 [Piromyces finnis]